MCGIAGVVGRGDVGRWRTAVERATKVLAHRGPDDQGVTVVSSQTDDGDAFHAVLGNVRLAILDLSPGGHMPMGSRDGCVWITYNGELYNFEELRAELEGLGHTFESTGDTEVVLHAYLQWGESCLERLNGMFALGIADRRGPRLRLLLARDQLGIKPCYYTERAGVFAFASEIKGLIALDVVSGELDHQALWDYFSYLYPPGPTTVYAGVWQLPPAHYLVWEEQAGGPRVRRYWSPLPDRDAGRPPEDEVEAAAELRALLTDAVRRQLVSEVPLGIFLSGGIDSTILTALAATATSKRVKTFTVVFEGDGIGAVDDRVYARRVADRYDTDHTELTVDMSEPEQLFELVTAFDQPFANPTFYLSYLISLLARRHVTVALSGVGGDELLGGYPRYRVLPYAAALRRAPVAASRLVGVAAEVCLRENDGPLRRRIKLLLRGLGRPLPEQYLRWTYYFAEEEKRRLLAPAAARWRGVAPSARLIAQGLEEAAQLDDVQTRIQYVDLQTFLPDNILHYTDRTSMAVSLEVRVPFLDQRVVGWSFRRPFSEKLSSGVSKRILRRAFGDLIPPENLAAPKRGFCPPLATWFRGPLDRYFDTHLTASYVAEQGIFDWAEIQHLRQMHQRRRRDVSMELFAIIMFDVWWRRYVVGDRGAAPIR